MKMTNRKYRHIPFGKGLPEGMWTKSELREMKRVLAEITPEQIMRVSTRGTKNANFKKAH